MKLTVHSAPLKVILAERLYFVRFHLRVILGLSLAFFEAISDRG